MSDAFEMRSGGGRPPNVSDTVIRSFCRLPRQTDAQMSHSAICSQKDAGAVENSVVSTWMVDGG